MNERFESLTAQFVTRVYADHLWFAITHRGHACVDTIRLGQTVVSWHNSPGRVELKLEQGSSHITFAGSDATAQDLRFSTTNTDYDCAAAIVQDVCQAWESQGKAAA